MPEFRLYYDEFGNVLFYTCEQSAGNFITIDAQTYAEGRHDIKVINGKIEKIVHTLAISKLIPTNDGTECASADISIVATGFGNTTHWKFTNVNYD